MVLSGKKIKEILFDDSIPAKQRLIISPILDIEKQCRDSQASIDLRLGQRFRTPRRARLEKLDYLDKDHKRNIELYKEESYVPIGDYFVLHPRQFVLGITLEWVHLPAEYAAYVIGRSSWGRDGLVIATATGVHPNYSGVLTLEMTNVGEIPLFLYPGLTIAQLFIHTVSDPVSLYSSPSSFASATLPTNVDAAQDDKEIISHIRNRLGIDPVIDSNEKE